MRVAKWITARDKPAAAQMLVESLRAPAALIGAPVLEADNVNDLMNRIEQQLESPELFAVISEAWKSISIDMLVDLMNERVVGQPLIDAIGIGPARLVARCSRIEAEIASIIVQAIVHAGALPSQNAEEFRPLLYDARIPSTIQKALLSAMSSSVAALAMTHAMFVGSRLEPWLAQALAETYSDGLHDYLRLLAALSSAVVSEEVLPLSERLDVPALQGEHDAALQRIDDQIRAIDPAVGESFCVVE